MKDMYPTRRGNGHDIVTSINRQDHLFSNQLLENGFEYCTGVSVDLIDLVLKGAYCLNEKSAPECYFNRESSGEIRSIFGVHLALNPAQRIAEMLRPEAQRVLGGDVFVSQSRVNFKLSGVGTGWGWHSDFETWHSEDGMPDMRCISFMICLTENNAVNGPLMVIPGSHRWWVNCAGGAKTADYKNALYDQKVGVPSKDTIKFLAEPEAGITMLTGHPGTVVAFDCNTMHGSTPNMTHWPRTNLFIVFSRKDNMFVKPFSGYEPRPEALAHRKHIV